MKKLLIILFLGSLCFETFAQRQPMEPSLLIGYQRYMKGSATVVDSLGNEGKIAVSPSGFFNIGYTAFFEHESLEHFTRRSRFTASALLNPGAGLYGLQIGGSYSYVAAIGFNANVIRQFPLVEGTWKLNLNPFVGLDFWFMSFHIGYNLQAELHPPFTPPAPPLSKLNYTFNIYWPLKRNKRMYR